MDIRPLTEKLSVSPQITAAQVAQIRAAGFRALVCNRPDGEAPDQPSYAEIEAAAQQAGLEILYQPIRGGQISDQDALDFGQALRDLPGPVLAYCRSGTRCTTLWSLSQAEVLSTSDILSTARAAGYDMSGVVRRLANGGHTPQSTGDARYDVVIVGAGAGGIAVAASLMARDSALNVAIIDPADVHYYQPGWTMVGAGIFAAQTTAKTMGALIPKGVQWIQGAVAAFEPQNNAVILEGCRVVTYDRLVVTPGLKLDWGAIKGLRATLGRNGVTSNYRYDLAPYTWDLVRGLRGGRALFTQPPMPIKCAGAPQKALYMSADHWHRSGALGDIDVQFMTAGAALFGVPDYVPALEKYIAKYNAALNFHYDLAEIDGPAQQATFRVAKPGAAPSTVTVDFDMIHVTPPQCAPDFIRVSPLADAQGWVDVDPATLRHQSYDNIWSLGDVVGAPCAKTAAAARKQAPVVAANLLADIAGGAPRALYDGYGACPLTVERGKIVLAEFGYGGALRPSFPKWLIDGTQPSRAAWILKEWLLPPVYWRAMLKGREWLARPGEKT